jgi:hypothetical protein
MKTLKDVEGRCRMVEGSEATPCWIWTGAMSGSLPRIYGPDFTATKRQLKKKLQGVRSAAERAAITEAHELVVTSQPGRRTVWHMKTRKALPKKWRVYGTCESLMCVNPEHQKAGPAIDVGAQTVKTGRFKNSMKRILANRAIGRKRSHLTPELIVEIKTSSESGLAIAKRLNLGRGIVSRVRVHGATSHQSIGLFFGLIR